MKKIIYSLIAICVGMTAFAQDNLQGTLYDATNNNPLAGAKIQTNNNTMTSTNEDGTFSVSCSAGMTVTISYVGYETQSFSVADCSQALTVKLTPSLNTLDEVQLVGRKDNDQRAVEKPVSLVSLRQTELKRGTGLFLDDAINSNVPGVLMTRRAVSSGQQFNIRGYGNGVGFRGATNNFDGQGYKVYFNNIPITDAEGITLLDDIDFGSVGSVDVIKGPAGSLYGLAIAGVVNLKTIRPEAGETSISQSVQGGSYGLARFTTQFQMGKEKSSLLLNYGHQISDGYMDHNASNKDFINAVMEFRPNDKQFVSTYFGFSNSYDERGGELTIEQYEEEDYSGNPRYIKNNAHSAVKSFRAGLSHNYKFTSWLSNTATVFGSGLNQDNSSAGGWTDKTPINYGTRITFDMNFDLGDDFALSGIIGFEFQEQKAQIAGYRMTEDPLNPEGYNIIGALRTNQVAKSKTHSLFSEWILKMPQGFSLTAGVGSSSMYLDLEDRLATPGSGKFSYVAANYTDMVSPHFAINKVFNENVSLYASYSKGFKAPVSGNVIISTTGELNTGLIPEEGVQIEFGSKGNLFNNKLHYQLAVFQAKFQNKFTSVAVPLDENTTAYTYIANGGELDNKGLEVLLKYTAYQSNSGFLSFLAPYVNAAYSDFTYGDYQYQSMDGDGNPVTVDYSGNDVAGVPPLVLNGGIDFDTNPGIYGNVNVAYRDEVPFTADGLNVAASFTLLNAKLGYRARFGKLEVDAYAGADNLLGTQYYYMVFLNQLEDAYIPAPLDPFFHGGITLKYQL